MYDMSDLRWGVRQSAIQRAFTHHPGRCDDDEEPQQRSGSAEDGLDGRRHRPEADVQRNKEQSDEEEKEAAYPRHKRVEDSEPDEDAARSGVYRRGPVATLRLGERRVVETGVGAIPAAVFTRIFSIELAGKVRVAEAVRLLGGVRVCVADPPNCKHKHLQLEHNS